MRSYYYKVIRRRKNTVKTRLKLFVTITVFCYFFVETRGCCWRGGACIVVCVSRASSLLQVAPLSLFPSLLRTSPRARLVLHPRYDVTESPARAWGSHLHQPLPQFPSPSLSSPHPPQKKTLKKNSLFLKVFSRKKKKKNNVVSLVFLYRVSVKK